MFTGMDDTMDGDTGTGIIMGEGGEGWRGGGSVMLEATGSAGVGELKRKFRLRRWRGWRG